MSHVTKNQRPFLPRRDTFLPEVLEPRVLLSGTTYVVNSLADVVANDGVVTLREALQAANTNIAPTTDVMAGSDSETDTITFDLPALQAEAGPDEPLVIVLTGRQLAITDDLVLTGPGADVLTIDARGGSRVIEVLFVPPSIVTASLTGLTITGGWTDEPGGGIYNEGNLSLRDVVISGNYSRSGGGIFNPGRASLRLDRVALVGNTASNHGGGGLCSSGQADLTSVLIAGNSALYGGGIYNVGSWTNSDLGKTSLTHVTISGNTATIEGGGIHNVGFSWNESSSPGGTMLLYNSIVAINTAQEQRNDVAGQFLGDRNLVGIDPGFADAAGGDYRLSPTSVGINLGRNHRTVDATGAPLAEDLAGQTRIIDGTADLGAYEYPGAPDPAREAPSVVVTTLQDLTDWSDGQTSLREALVHGMLGDVGSVVTFDPRLAGGTAVLDGQELVLYSSVSINGPALPLTIDAAQASRIIGIGGADPEVVLSNLTLTRGHAGTGGAVVVHNGHLTLQDAAVTDSTAVDGGGIANLDRLSLVRTIIDGNSVSFFGGGIYNGAAASLEMNDSTVSGNFARRHGGGIYGGDEASLTLVDSLVSGNAIIAQEYSFGGYEYSFGAGLYIEGSMAELIRTTVEDNTGTGIAGSRGGGIHCLEGLLRLTDSVLLRNRVTDEFSNARGGGLFARKSQVSMAGSLIQDNQADIGGGVFTEWSTIDMTRVEVQGNGARTGDGGGLYLSSGDWRLIESTVHGNTARNNGGGISAATGSFTGRTVNTTFSGNRATYGRGGGAWLEGSELFLTNVTVTENVSGVSGGGVAGGTLALHNSLLAGNLYHLGSAPSDLSATCRPDSSHNLIGVRETASLQWMEGTNGNLVGTATAPLDARLGPLAHNGGPIRTHALLEGSPAIDAGRWPNAIEEGLVADQRGLPRTDGDGDGVIVVDIGAYEALAEQAVPIVWVQHVFYNNSVLDGADPAANTDDDAAIDPTRQALAPGQASTSANVTSYARGLNGLMIDIAHIGSQPVEADDFTVRVCTDGATWVAGPAPTVSVRHGAGVDGSDRVTLTWPDGAIRDGWLEVTARTSLGLAEPRTFRYGNLRGDFNGDGHVDDRDLSILLGHWGDSGAGPAGGDTLLDGLVDDRDLSIVLANWGSTLPALVAAAPPAELTAEPTVDAVLADWDHSGAIREDDDPTGDGRIEDRILTVLVSEPAQEIEWPARATVAAPADGTTLAPSAVIDVPAAKAFTGPRGLAQDLPSSLVDLLSAGREAHT